MNYYEFWLIKRSGLFDPVYYLLNNPDVLAADIDPLEHFVKSGWKEGRNPSKYFNLNFYLNSNPDVESLQLNPLVHYIRYGKTEGRLPLPEKANGNWPTHLRIQNAAAKKRLTKNIVGMSVSYIRTYGFRNFLRKVNNTLFPNLNAQYLSNESSLHIYRDKFVGNPLIPEEEIQPFDVKVSVVIPTKNAGSELDFLLKMLKRQKGIREVELVVVDSGSTDDTVDMARQYDAKIVEILPEQFSHSYARNLGADTASGDYLLFLVQDALPPNRTWVYELLSMLKENDVSAISCAESPREDADLFYRLLCWNHYNFLDVNRGDRIFRLPVSKDHLSLRKNAQLSDLACLISKETFSEYTYRRDYGEDLDLGLRLIKDGKTLIFSGEIRVIHSHNRSAYYFLKRGYVDHLFLADLFTDFEIPRIKQEDLFADIAFSYQFVDEFIRTEMDSLQLPVAVGTFNALITQAFGRYGEKTFPSSLNGQKSDHKDQQFTSFVELLIDSTGFKKGGQKYNGILTPTLSGYVASLTDYLTRVYEYIDEGLAEEIKTCLFKQLGIIIGSYLAFGYKRNCGNEPVDPNMIHTTLKAGV